MWEESTRNFFHENSLKSTGRLLEQNPIYVQFQFQVLASVFLSLVFIENSSFTTSRCNTLVRKRQKEAERTVDSWILLPVSWYSIAVFLKSVFQLEYSWNPTWCPYTLVSLELHQLPSHFSYPSKLHKYLCLLKLAWQVNLVLGCKNWWLLEK